MILNSKAWCMRNSNPNVLVFIRVKNSSTCNIKFLMQYVQMITPVVKESGIITPGQTEQIVFPVSARSISVTIFDLSPYHFDIIFNEALPNSARACYEVTGNSPNLVCQKVPCR